MRWASLGLKDGPGFEKCLDPVPAIFAVDAGVFKTTPGRLWIIRHAVDHDAPGPYLRSHAPRALEVGAEDGGVETILRVVGDPDRLLLGVIRDDTQHGAKNLFTGDRHVVLHVHEHRGLHEVTGFETVRMALATREH